uniref:Uncharacterized protein n=2 Tax=unclassified Caudoviricetes TaxID=2788787 RepID=A0A8S5VBA0_9CAUD|nr:MAG TPA: hypothetical protein [Siphoviridae sp. ctfrT39]DAG03982.1 MAG TPA: hypothetical protein [Siphoviridae sp. ct0vA12]
MRSVPHALALSDTRVADRWLRAHLPRWSCPPACIADWLILPYLLPSPCSYSRAHARLPRHWYSASCGLHHLAHPSIGNTRKVSAFGWHKT